MRWSAIWGRLSPIRDADWLTRERARAWSTNILVIIAALGAVWVGSSRGGLDPLGKPLGADFVSFWTASKLALAGHAAQVYDVAAHNSAERAAFPQSRMAYEAFFYPPLYLLVCLPLALAPYLVSLFGWLGATGYVCWRAMRAILGEAGQGALVVLLAFPGLFVNIVHGQNGLLTAALFGFAALWLDPRPILAGVMIGLLAFKPHLAVLAPLALLAAGRWRTLAAAAVTVLTFAAAAALAFGPDIFRVFLAVPPLARLTLEHDLVGPAKMASAFAAARLLHAGVPLAYAVQAVFALAAVVLVFRVCRVRAGGLAQGAALAAASLLASPFLLDYDLMILAVPMAWIVREARGSGFRDWEKITLLTAFAAPIATRAIGLFAGIPTAPFVLLAMLWVVGRRATAAVPD